MFDALANLLAPPVLERLTLLLNHVLRAEPAASARLAAHSGRTFSMQLANWPPLLPVPPALAWRVTPAGLLEWCGVPLGSAGNGSGALATVEAATGPDRQRRQHHRQHKRHHHRRLRPRLPPSPTCASASTHRTPRCCWRALPPASGLRCRSKATPRSPPTSAG
ncbi:MAG: hypothetical protein U1F49_11870 [Rubrivivax sp.]